MLLEMYKTPNCRGLFLGDSQILISASQSILLILDKKMALARSSVLGPYFDHLSLQRHLAALRSQ